MIRRHIIAQDLRYSHETTPRKQRTYAHSSAFQPSLLYRSPGPSPLGPRGIYVPGTNWDDSPAQKWIGKVFISNETSPQELQIVLQQAKKRDYITESEVAQYAKPNYFRIIRVRYSEPGLIRGLIEEPQMIVRSFPNVRGRPKQLNLFLDENDIIREVRYF